MGELFLDRLFQLTQQKPSVREISRFQPVRRDFSLILPQKAKWVEIDSILAGLATSTVPELIDWQVREVLHDAKNGHDANFSTGEYSLLLGVTFQAHDRTLRDEELQAFSQSIIEAVSQAGARLRT